MSRRTNADQAARPRGPFSGMSRPPMDSMPRIRTAFARGLVGMWSSPVVVGSTIAWLLIEWVVIVALGYPGPVAPLAHVSALPPMSTVADISISTGILGIRSGLLFVFATGAVHALWLSVLTGLAIETVETGTASRWGAVRGLRAFPVALALHVIGVAVLFASQFVVTIGGRSLAVFLQIAVLVGMVWALGSAPTIAVAEGRRLTDCLGRAVRAARLPGSGNLSFAAIYVVPVFAVLVVSSASSFAASLLDVNPPPTAWVFVVVMNLLHGSVLAAFSMRYLAIATEVPDAPVRAPSRGRGAPARTRRDRSRGRR